MNASLFRLTLASTNINVLRATFPLIRRVIDIGDLFPILLSPWLKHLDLSRNKKVRGNVDVFKKEVFHSLREVYLHYSAVTGDYSSFRSGLGTKLPHLEVATLLETKVTGDIACLPGDNERSSLDVHAKVERI